MNGYVKQTKKIIKTPLSLNNVPCEESDLEIFLPNSIKTRINFCAVNDLKLNIKIPSIRDKIADANNKGILLTPNMPKYLNDTVCVQGILGIDYIPLLSVCELSPINGNYYFRFSNGYVPVGNMQICKPNNRTNKTSVVNKQDGGAPEIACKNKYAELKDECRKQNQNLIKRKRRKTSKNRNKARRSETVTRTNKLPNKKYKTMEPSAREVRYAESKLIAAITQEEKSPLIEQIERSILSIESLGIQSDTSDYDTEIINRFKAKITKTSDRYSVEIPWDYEKLSQIPSNFVICKILSRKIQERVKQKGIATEYDQAFDDQLTEGIIEPVNIGDDFDPENFKFIPHHPVIKTDNGTTKVRPVFNCSFKTKDSPSLNDATYDGINMTKNMLDILNYSRTNDHVILADIKKAFLQIELKTEYDRNKFCFILYRNNRYMLFRYTRIIFGFVTSPFILNYVLQHHAENCRNAEVKQIIKTNMYVDNLVITNNDPEKASQLANDVTTELNRGGFTLREFTSNTPEIMNRIKVEGDKLTESKIVKLLGYSYSTVDDKLTLKDGLTLNKNATTRRQILSAISEIYDPLGIANPLTINFKLLMRSIIEKRVKWDEPLPADIITTYDKLCKIFKLCQQHFVIDRKMINSEAPADINCFVDASKSAYGFVSYITQSDESKFMFSKTKVSPQPPKSLPTLELLAVFLALKCLSNILEEHHMRKSKINKITIYCDSQVALAWLLKGSAMKKNVFVNNRLKDIKEINKRFATRKIEVSYKFATGESNIADLITRNTTQSQIEARLSEWLEGPSWLLTGNQPSGNLGCIPDQFTEALTVAATTATTEAADTEIIKIEKFPSYSQLLEVTSKVFFAIGKFKRQPISTEQAKVAAFRYLIKRDQKRYYEFVIKYLNDRTQNNVPIVFQLNLFLDPEGIIRSKSRADKSLILDYNERNPVLLNSSSHLSELLIRYAHEQCKHLGVDTTINFLRRSGFWLTQARGSVHRLIKKCVACQRFNNRTFKPPAGTLLPAERVNETNPFKITGIDYTGHFYVQSDQQTANKVYILIFTCFVTRAVHLELLNDMTTEAFVMAFIRFSNRYTIPSVVYSDNAKSFISGGNLLHEITVSSLFRTKLEPYNIEFKRIPIYSPWYGSVYERLIKTVKQCINKTIGRSKISYVNFLTLLSDVEAVLNNRPLTYRSADNSIDVVTPNHFLKCSSQNNNMILTATDDIPDIEDWDDPDYEPYNKLITSLDVREKLINKYSQVWLKTYLLSLKRRVAEGCNNTNEPLLQPGRVALLQVPDKARQQLKLVRIIEHIPSNDGLIRAVKIKTSDGNTSNIAIKNLIPLELNEDKMQELPADGSELSDSARDPLFEEKSDENVEFPFDSSIQPPEGRKLRDASKNSRILTKCILEEEEIS